MSTAAADLQGADTITTALNLLGANGERWTQGHATVPDRARGGVDYCTIGALIAAAPDQAAYSTAAQAVKEAVGGNVSRWNDNGYTDFANVRVILRRAANNLREAALTPLA